jgi:hypothetical protein
MMDFICFLFLKNVSTICSVKKYFLVPSYDNTIKNKAMLPKFLLADNSLETPETIFVVHTETPRFIVEADIEDFWSNQVMHWIDGEPTEDVAEDLINEAEEFLEKEFENEELLADEDED